MIIISCFYFFEKKNVPQWSNGYILRVKLNGSYRLQLPGKIKDNDSFAGTYDCDKGDFTLSFSKVNKGEHFENLEMITSLLAPKKKSTVIPNIEVIGKL